MAARLHGDIVHAADVASGRSPSGHAADVVLLAAGKSSRVGTPKGLVVAFGRPWLELQLEALERAGIRRVVVVVSPENRSLYEAGIPGLESRATLVVNADPDRGPFSSLQCGLSVVPPSVPAFVLPVDVPAPATPLWPLLLAALERGVDAVVPTLDGRGGHPVLLSPALAAELAKVPAEEGRLDEVLADPSRLERVVRVPVTDERVRMNLNTLTDWGKLSSLGARPGDR
jgi:molybdenum cofactor cytidylyltransferase